MQLVDFSGRSIDSTQVHGVANGGIPCDVAAAGRSMVAVQGLQQERTMFVCVMQEKGSWLTQGFLLLRPS